MSGHSGSAPPFSFGYLESAISSLKNCQSCINAGTDVAANVAFSLVETRTKVEDENCMENVMLEYAALDRELNQYIWAVEGTVNQLKRDCPETIPDLQSMVQEKLSTVQRKNCDANLQKNEKFMQFKEQLRNLKQQYGLQEDSAVGETEDQDDDMIVTQSQTNSICPITQLEMKNPVKNKVCGHYYEEEAIKKMIQSKQKRKKKACCPKIGCSHSDVKLSDLVPTPAFKRAMESSNKRMSDSQSK
ncbi:E3 SUMO-protein ligase NSE2 isoform X2 [Ornithorhynchus anatinus]|uniref:E3 SUMO-protein ligase NSE2 n=1 Tax=Ornithorhynchus anatinus TaxID=9258 RepID=A0A6I8P9B6_ORNAN|nr:E3 SUMO-protein ligase NSE2 isoform X2 [Ornithorhynchus anatinus]XP_007659327.1 E3 SUMO-protein ligase NSE2 isoform X2 [Ornithorhynchus anatinus]